MGEDVIAYLPAEDGGGVGDGEGAAYCCDCFFEGEKVS